MTVPSIDHLIIITKCNYLSIMSSDSSLEKEQNKIENVPWNLHNLIFTVAANLL